MTPHQRESIQTLTRHHLHAYEIAKVLQLTYEDVLDYYLMRTFVYEPRQAHLPQTKQTSPTTHYEYEASSHDPASIRRMETTRKVFAHHRFPPIVIPTILMLQRKLPPDQADAIHHEIRKAFPNV